MREPRCMPQAGVGPSDALRGCEFIRRTAFSGRRCRKNACDFDALKRASYILSQPLRA
jgi:hypothetical protein